jgi:hypothetical protein
MVKSILEKLNGETSSKQTTSDRIEPRTAQPALAKSGLRGYGSDPDPFLGHFTGALLGIYPKNRKGPLFHIQKTCGFLNIKKVSLFFG